MNGTTLLCALIGHLVGDYLLQNDWMALNKKKHSGPCLVHCFIWATSVCFFSGWFIWLSPAVYTHHIDKSALVWAVLFITHFIQDRTNIIASWMDAIGQKQFRTGPCAPWAMIAVDNVWHIVTIWAVWRFIV